MTVVNYNSQVSQGYLVNQYRKNNFGINTVVDLANIGSSWKSYGFNSESPLQRILSSTGIKNIKN